MTMNYWKPLALVSMAGMVFSFGYNAAHATTAPAPEPTVAGAQPHMEAALDHLRQARAELDKAEHNKGGWREAAVLKTDGAIADTKRGMSFADK
jgi:hypothetical protein